MQNSEEKNRKPRYYPQAVFLMAIFHMKQLADVVKSTTLRCRHIEMKLKQNSFKKVFMCFVSVSFQCANSFTTVLQRIVLIRWRQQAQ